MISANFNSCLDENFSDGNKMFALCKKLFPICRSITGDGFRQSLEILNAELGGIMQMHEIKSGTKVFDWVIPPEWNCDDAYIITPNGEKICDFRQNNLHLMGYSEPIDAEIDLDELNEHLYSLESLPEAIPYVTSYYKRRWGFCIAHNARQKLQKGKYKVYINSNFNENGVLNYADFVIPATKKCKDEVLFSTYLCHPSMANNELSGPVVATFLAKKLLSMGGGERNLSFNYRFVFIPETIGSIVYISKHLKHLQKRVKAGFVLSCLGDNDAYSLIHSPSQATLADKVALHTLCDKPNFKEYGFLSKGSDERQYCSPKVNLPVVGLCRTRYGDFKEYHTSLDNLNFISAQGLQGSLDALSELVENLECSGIYENLCFCEPNLGKRGLYPTISQNFIPNFTRYIVNFLALCDGKNDVIDIAKKLGIKAFLLKECIDALLKHKLIKKVKK